MTILFSTWSDLGLYKNICVKNEMNVFLGCISVTKLHSFAQRAARHTLRCQGLQGKGLLVMRQPGEEKGDQILNSPSLRVRAWGQRSWVTWGLGEGDWRRKRWRKWQGGIIWGWSVWPSDVKRFSIQHSSRPSWMVGGLNWSELGKISSMFLKNNFWNHYYSDPSTRGTASRGQLKESYVV